MKSCGRASTADALRPEEACLQSQSASDRLNGDPQTMRRIVGMLLASAQRLAAAAGSLEIGAGAATAGRDAPDCL